LRNIPNSSENILRIFSERGVTAFFAPFIVPDVVNVVDVVDVVDAVVSLGWVYLYIYSV